MTHNDAISQWVDERQAAKILGLHPGTLRSWRMADRRAGRGTPDRPGRGNLVYRKFGRVVRYALSSILPEVIDARR